MRSEAILMALTTSFTSRSHPYSIQQFTFSSPVGLPYILSSLVQVYDQITTIRWGGGGSVLTRTISDCTWLNLLYCHKQHRWNKALSFHKWKMESFVSRLCGHFGSRYNMQQILWRSHLRSFRLRLLLNESICIMDWTEILFQTQLCGTLRKAESWTVRGVPHAWGNHSMNIEALHQKDIWVSNMWIHQTETVTTYSLWKFTRGKV